MSADLEKDIVTSLDGIIEDYNRNGILDVELATNFIEKLVTLSVDDKVVDDIGKTFANIYNGNIQPASVNVFSSAPAGLAKASLFSGIQNVLSKVIDGLWTSETTTTTYSVTSIFRFEMQENGTKTLIWDFNWTKTTTPIQQTPVTATN